MNTIPDWSNKFKKPSWQRQSRSLWTITNQSIKPSPFAYKPINTEFDMQTKAFLGVEGIGGNGGYEITGSFVLEKNGSIFMSARGFTPAASFPQATIYWQLTAEIEVNEEVIIKKGFFNDSSVSFWPKDQFTIIGTTSFKLPPPSKLSDKVVLKLIGLYTYDTGTGQVSPWPPTISQNFPIDIIIK